MRTKATINSHWRFSKNVQSLDNDGIWVDLPHTWNNQDGQDGGNDYYRGVCVYEKVLENAVCSENEQLYIEFSGVSSSAEVWVNGSRAARHDGGYSAFRVELTPWANAPIHLRVLVDNGPNDFVYPQKADFTFYGGIYRGVSLIWVSSSHFSLDYYGSNGLRITPAIEGTNAKIEFCAWVTGPAQNVRFTVQNVGSVCAVVEDNKAFAVLTLPNVHLWQGTEDPYLYTAHAELLLENTVTDELDCYFGCRMIGFDAERGFLLNGHEYPLRGVSRHQDRAGLGNALTLKEHQEDIALIKEIGANTVRLAHYQHSQEFYDLCDENGLIVWTEIPYITQHMPNARQNTLDQMRELIVQCYHHPSIVCWGLSNEISASCPVTEDLLENHRVLNDLCHQLDPTRKTTMACVSTLEPGSPLLDIPDILSYNHYFGWYWDDLEENERFFDGFHSQYPNRIIGFSEYGADANPAFQTPDPQRGDYSESYQCIYHEHLLNCIENRPYLWATHVWNMFDFAADGRDEGGKHGENQKGLVTMDRALKKDAFYLYKAAWSKEPFVHLCGRRYVDRTESETEIKVYSNQSEVTLYVDGKLFQMQEGKRIFRFCLPITGRHVIEAQAGNCKDRIEIRKVEVPNPSYQYLQQGGIVNWFDQGECDPNFYSIEDKFGELMASPAAPLIQALMDRIVASRGDVAISANQNPALQARLAKVSLQSLLKQGGDIIPTEEILQLNRNLQSIKKQ